MNILLRDVSVVVAAQRRTLLDRITCTFLHGGITLLVGPTGAGKSTILDLLAGLRTPDAGRIVQESGDARRTLSARDLRKLTTLSCQSPEEQLFAPTVQHELSYTVRPFCLAPAERRARASAALAYAGIVPAWLSRNPLLQSTGQKRRIALACAFAPPTPWLLLDEPTAGLDPAARLEFLHQLLAWREAVDGSVVMATHDLSTLFPAATRVIILAGGRVTADVAAADLRADPAPLQEAGVGLPPEFAASRLLCALGVPLPRQNSPEQWADAIIRHAASRAGAAAVRPASPGAMSPASVWADRDQASAAPAIASAIAPAVRAAVLTLDIRARWLVYILLTAGILLQQTWPGTLAAALLSLALLLYIQAPWPALWRTARPYLLFILLAALFAGLQLGPAPHSRLPVHFTLSRAWVTTRQLSVILIALVWGRMLTIAATAGELRRGLSEMAATLPIGRRPATVLAFGAGLVLRMTAEVLREWRRFSRIVRARGKSSVKEGKIALRDVPALVIPLILAMLQHTEDLTLAMEARGCRTVGAEPIPRQKARPLRRRDLVAIAVGAACFLLLLAAGRA